MIKIEVTGNSIPEVADKLLAIGASLRGNTTTTPAWPAPKSTIVGQEVAEAALAVVHSVVEVAEAAPVDPTPAPKSALAATVSESQPTTTEPSSTPAAPAEEITPKPAEIVENTPAAPAEEITPAAELNFDTDVAPYVLQVVKEKGKPVAQEILSQFGVEKASLLDPTLWPELVQQLKDAL
jgi:hypothetical protein